MSNTQNSNNKIKTSKELSRLVGQSNDLVRKTFYSNLEINDIKLFRTIISKINYRDSLFEDLYIINYDELDLAGISKSNRFPQITHSLEKLASTYVNILDKDNMKTRVGLIQNKFKYPKGSKQIYIQIDEDLKPYLLELSGEYTKYELSNIGSIKSVQQLKLYEILRSWAKQKIYKTTLENLKDYLEIKKGTYKEYGNFKQRILSKAIDIINKETDIIVEIEELRTRSSKTDTLIFHITLKSEEKIEFDLTEFIDKVIIDKKNKKFLIREYIKGKNQGYYNLKMLSLESYKEVTLPTDMKKSELYEIVKGRIDIFELIKQKNNNKKKIENATKSISSKVKDLRDSKKSQSKLSGLTQEERINKFKNGDS